MSNKRKKSRAEPQKRSITLGTMSFEDLFMKDPQFCARKYGYTRIADNPEVAACIHLYADMVSDMTINLMKNTTDGDIRIKNALSRVIDIDPHPLYTRKALMYWLVKKMLIEGNADIFPKYNGSLLQQLNPITADYDYETTSDGFRLVEKESGKIMNYDTILHFAYNPSIRKPWLGEGFKVQLKDLLVNLKQASNTKKAYMTDNFKPTVIIAVDALTEEQSYEEGRDKIRKQFGIDTANGKPWVIPNDLIKVETVKPLTLNDLAIDSSVQLDKKSVGMVFGVPLFYLGLNPFNRDEHNNFINTKIKPIANIIQQVLTKGLIYGEEYYLKFSARSLYSYSLDVIGNMARENMRYGIFNTNEARDLMDYGPIQGGNEYKILENMIPSNMSGDQNKLNNQK